MTIKKQKLLQNFQKNIYCRIAVSKIHGVGVVATRDITKGLDPFSAPIPRARWIKCHKSELAPLPTPVLEMVGDFFTYEADGSIWLPESGLNGIDVSFFMNTSKQPNVKTIDGGINFVTTRQIKVGEELTVDYETFR